MSTKRNDPSVAPSATAPMLPDVMPPTGSPPSSPRSTDIGRPIRKAIPRWWKKKPEEALRDVRLSQAMADVGVLSMQHLARRLTDRKTPDDLKDQIALAMGPKLAVTIKGQLPQPTNPDDASPADILGDYAIGRS